MALIGELPVGDVGLPHLVWQVGLEADQAAAGSLLWLGPDQSLSSEDPPDRRDGRRRQPIGLPGQVEGDCLCSAVVAFPRELVAQPHDRPDGLWRGLVLASQGAPRARLQRLSASVSVAGQQLVDPAAMHPMSCCQLADRPPFQHVRLDEIPRHLHRKTPSRWCLLCPDTSVDYQLQPHTPLSVIVVSQDIPDVCREISPPISRNHTPSPPLSWAWAAALAPRGGLRRCAARTRP